MNKSKFSLNFRDFLIEKSEQLDISIKAAGKYLTTQAKVTEFLTSNVIVEHKTDGIKLTVIKKDNNGDLNDYIFAYKGEVLYNTEFDYQPTTRVKSESIGNSQFKLVFQHFSKLRKNSIPVGTELFIEFLMRKPTLSSNYNTKHKMVLIGYSKSSYEEKFGRLKTKNTGFYTDKRDDYAKELKIDHPQLLFSGIMNSVTSFERGIQNSNLKKEFDAAKLSMNWDNEELLIDDIRRLFLSVESKYGGTEEGVVVKYNDKIIKFQQEYQIDQEARKLIKAKYNEDDPEANAKYWKNVQNVALDIVNGMVFKSRKLDDLLLELSNIVKRYKVEFSHSKRPESVIKDDIQQTTKMLIIKNLKGNNNALVLGKFRVLTKDGHYKLIKQAQMMYDNVVVCLVTNKNNKDTRDLRMKMLKETFPNIEIIEHSTGNLVGILNKSPININAIYAGTDRVSSYREQMKTNLGITVKEVFRTDNDISASKVIENIEDENFFKSNTPKQIHSLYQEIKRAYK